MASFHYRQEIYRKLIHLSSLWMAGVIYFCEKPVSLAVFGGFMSITLIYEGVRRQDHALAHLLERVLGAALRPEEKAGRFKPSGAIYVLAAAFLCVLLFPRMIAVTALAMALTGDAAASLAGIKFGRRKVFDKSLEGAVAFFAAALVTADVIAAALPAGAGYMSAAAIAAFAAAAVELTAKKTGINDNLSVPLAAGAVMLLLL